MKKSTIIKLGIILVIFIGLIKIDPLSRYASDEEDIFADDRPKYVNVNTAYPGNIKYKEYLEHTHGSIEDISYNRESKILKIKYNDASHVEGDLEARSFALQSADLLREVRDNRNIGGIEFSQDISLSDSSNIERAITAYFDKADFDKINYSTWVDDLGDQDENFVKFFNSSTQYMIYLDILNDFDRAEKNLLDYSKLK